MISSLLILAVATAVAAFYAWRREPAALGRAARFSADQGLRLAIRLPFSLIAASCLAELIPDRYIVAVMGPDTGLTGILLASLFGGLLPGGPIVSFPLAIMLARDGAGGPQVIALITGWSVYAFHRVIAYEIPIMGARFVALRMISSSFVPPASGVLAGLLAAAVGWSIAIK
jgi:uncharacterized membrane protein YraQ (UPF0718 family)